MATAILAAVVERGSLRLDDALALTARGLVARLDADACAISRVVGDVLIFVTQAAAPAQTLHVGQGFLVSDFPETQAMLADGRPRMLTVSDAAADSKEIQLLREFGFGALLMLRLDLDGEPWGLVEIYREEPRPFLAADARLAKELLAHIRLVSPVPEG